MYDVPCYASLSVAVAVAVAVAVSLSVGWGRPAGETLTP